MKVQSVPSHVDVSPIFSLSFTRPQNTTAYTAADVIGIADAGTPANAGSAVHAFATDLPPGSTVMITDTKLLIGLSAVPSGMTSFRLHIYNAAPTAILDNAAFTLADADRASYMGFIALGTPADLGNNLFIATSGGTFRFNLSGQTFYGILETVGAYTPASATLTQLVLLGQLV